MKVSRYILRTGVLELSSKSTQYIDLIPGVFGGNSSSPKRYTRIASHISNPLMYLNVLLELIISIYIYINNLIN